MFKNAKLKPECRPESPVSVRHRTSDMEAMVLGFAAENSLSYSVVPKKIKLSKELSMDPGALDKFSMDRTTASYKLRYGLAKTINEETLESIKSNFFSLNLDESTINNKKVVLGILVSCYSPGENKIVMQHLTAISLLKVDVDSIYKDITKYFQNYRIPWNNIISIMIDSCNVLRGSKSGFEKQICDTVGPHLLDIDGDSAHNTHDSSSFASHSGNFWKVFVMIFILNLSGHHRDICLILGVTYTISEKYVPHRWLSVYDVY